MILVELAFQGVKGFPSQLRLPFRGGVNVACNVEPQRRRVVLDAIYHCLYPDSSRSEATAHLADPDAADSRIALTFHGRDRVTYRLIRDVVNGAMKLYRFDPEAKKYRLFTASAAEAAQYVRVQQQLLDEVSFERLFMYSPESMPSKGDRAQTRSGSGLVTASFAPSAPGLPPARFLSSAMGRPGSTLGRMPNALESAAGGFNPTNALVLSEMAQAAADDPAPREVLPETIAEKKSLLLRLRADLDAVQRAQRAQQEIDQLTARQFEISERLQALSKLDAELRGLLAVKEADTSLQNLPPTLAERLRTFEEREERFRVDEAKIQEEMIRVAREADEDHVLPLQQDRYFLLSVVLALVFVGLALLLSRPLIAILNVPAALVAVAAAFRYIADLERGTQRQGRVKAIEDRLDRLNKQHDLDTGVTRRMMDKLDVDSASALLERVDAYEAREAEIARVSAELTAQREDAGARREELELQQIQQRVQVLESEVIAASGAMHGEETLKRRVASLEAELGPDVPPRLKSPPLGLVGSPAPRPRPSSITGPADLAADLVAQSPFSSHVSAASPLAQTGEFFSSQSGELAVTPPPSPRPRGGSGVFPAPPRGQTGDLPGFGTGDLFTSQSSGVFAPPSRGHSGVHGRPIAGAVRPITSDIPVVRGTGEFDASRPGEAAPRAPSLPGFPAPSGPPPSGPSGPALPAFPGPQRPSLTSSGGIRPSAPGMPATPPAPVVPAPRVTGEDAHFDFGGGYIGEDEEEEGYGSGGGSKGGAQGGGSDGGASTAGYLAIGSGMSGFGGGGLGGYGDGEGPGAPDRSRELVQAVVDQLSVGVDDLATRLVPRLGQYLEAFTAKAYNSASLGPRGEVSVHPAEGEPVAYTDLPEDAVDTVDLALRFALAECVLRKFRMPVLIDDPMTELDPKRRKLLAQMLTYFGRASQVVVLSGQADLQGTPLELGPI